MSPSSILSWLEGLRGAWAYLAVFVVAFAEHALFVGTFVPGEVILPLTGVAPFVAPGAGWAGIPYRRFLPANALANALWGPVMVGAGYLFGVQAARLEGPWRWAGLALTAAILALAFWRLRAIGADLARAAAQGDVRDA